jgi:hypothetical protein
VWIHPLAEAKLLVPPVQYKQAGILLIGLEDSFGEGFFGDF